jgi:hypothetical protein
VSAQQTSGACCKGSDWILTFAVPIIAGIKASGGGAAPIVIAPQIKLVSQTGEIEKRKCSVVIKFLKAHRLKSPEGARAFSSQAAMPGLVVADD